MANALAEGKESTAVTGAIAEREARIKEIEEELAGVTAIADLDVEAFRASIMEVAADWRDHLRKNPSVGQQMLRKILPHKLKIMPSAKPRGVGVRRADQLYQGAGGGGVRGGAECPEVTRAR